MKSGTTIKTKLMEERMLGLGLLEMDSSELMLRGGASSAIEGIVNKIRYVINFIADYIPKLVKGFVAGYGLKIF